MSDVRHAVPYVTAIIIVATISSACLAAAINEAQRKAEFLMRCVQQRAPMECSCAWDPHGPHCGPSK